MEFDLHPSVRFLLQTHASPADINRAAAEFYHTGIDSNILLCYAVHYGHKQYMSEGTYNSWSSYSPLMTAVYNKAHDLIQFQVEELNVICYSYHESFGKFRNEKLITDKPKTIWEAIFEVDDPIALQMLSEYCYFQSSTLVRLTNFYGARNCFEAITGTIRQPSAIPLDTTQNTNIVPFDAINAATPLVENDRPNPLKPTHEQKVQCIRPLVIRTCTQQGKITSLMREDTLLMWNSLTEQGMENEKRFVSSADEKTLVKLLSGTREELVRHCQQEYDESSKALPISDDGSSRLISNLDLHSKIILECWQCFLDNAAPDILRNTVYIHSLQKWLTHCAVGAKFYSTVNRVISVVCAERSLFLLNTMTKMLMQSSAKFETINYKTDMLNILHPEPCSITMPVTNQFCKHIMILIAYGRCCITFDLSDVHYLDCSKEATYVRGAARVILSMLPHDRYEAYRLDVMRREELLVNELNKSSPNEQEIMKLKKDIENTHDVSTPRPLQQLCRLKLYQIIPGNKRPETVYKLNIPDYLKHMLTLGVHPDLQYDLKMKSAEHDYQE